MREVRLAAWLIRRISLRGEGAAVPALLGIGMASIVFLGLSSLSAEQVSDRQHDRATDNTVLVDPSQSTGDSDDLLIVDPNVTNARRWNGYKIRREFYAAGESRLVAPGVPVMPAPGDFYASPDLVELIASDPVVAALFSSERLVGEIGPAGLVQPHELRAVVGVGAADHILLTKVDGFGGTPAPNVAESTPNPVLDASVTAYVLALVWIPAAFFVLIISRLAASRRARRANALHLIGYPKWRIQLLHFVEAACICVPATLIACVTHWGVTRRASTLPGTSFGFYPSDAQLPPGVYLVLGVVAMLLVCFAVSTDRLTDRPARPGRSGRRTQGVTRLGAGVLAVGFVLLALPSAVSLEGALTPIALWTGMVLSGVGIAVAGPALLIRVLAMRVQRVAAAPLVGRRMASHRVTTALRLASVMSVIIVLLLGSQSFATVLNGGSAQDWSQRAEAQGQVPVVATDLSGALTLGDVSSLDSVGGATQLRTVRTGDDFVNVVYSSCERLGVLIGRRDASECPGTQGPRWLGKPPLPTDHELPGELVLPNGKTVPLPAPTAALELPGLPDTFAGALLLPTELAPSTRQRDGSAFFLLTPAAEVARVLARLSSLDPTIQIDLGALDRHNPDTQQYPTQVEWLGVGAVISLLIGFLSLLVVSLGDARERSPRMRALRLLGASRRQLFTTHVWCVAVPIVLVGLGAVVVGWLAAQAMRNIDERAYLAPQQYGVTIVAVVVGAFFVCAVTWPSVTRPSQRAGTFGA